MDKPPPLDSSHQGTNTSIPLPHHFPPGPASWFTYTDHNTGLVYTYLRSNTRVLYQGPPFALLPKGFVRPAFNEDMSVQFAQKVKENKRNEVVQFLPFLYKINVNFLDHYNKSPLDYAVENQNYELCDILCSAGGIVWNDLASWEKYTKPFPFLQQQYDVPLTKEFTRLSVLGDVTEMEKLWHNSPPNSICPNVPCAGQTPLDYSIGKNCLMMADFLCSIGARTFFESIDYLHPLTGNTQDFIIKYDPVCNWNKFQTYDWVKGLEGVGVNKAMILLKEGVDGRALLTFTTAILAEPPYEFRSGPRRALVIAIQELQNFNGP